MAWRMNIDISFQTEDEMKAMMNFVEKKRSMLLKQSGELPIPCQVTTHECMHDVGGPCGGYKIVEFDGITDHGVPAEDAVPEEVKGTIKAPLEAEKVVLEAEKATLVAEKAALTTEVASLKAPKGTTGEVA